MSNTKTPEQIAEEVLDGYSEQLHIADVRVAVEAAIRADRAQIAQALAEKSHPDDWGVPCVYVKNFSKTHLGIEVEV